ncbi:uncharacterized protein LOC100377028 [Saccoglossus kowalevskii]|uniref:Uncharacterized protein LOC100377028 n=1 Tax=Saccoglossus kowalevskii TaxID=10224 RepID=A0ABM0MCS6_SACKO|nr:PREDICTED: uncharacterized protein LOC100377028 [Saccoglossus kowalevskii]
MSLYLIDPDGDGPLNPFTVHCDMWTEASAVTTIRHNQEDRTHVQGYDEPGSYMANITYGDVSIDQIRAVIDTSDTCEQWIGYDCYHSAFNFDTDVPNAWWVDYSGTNHYYWGSSGNQEGFCQCGVNGDCDDATGGINDALNIKCNCDNNDNKWRTDEGYLTDKTVLPVTALQFGDSGDNTEEGYHTLGPLTCIAAETPAWTKTSGGVATIVVICIIIAIATLIAAGCVYRIVVVACYRKPVALEGRPSLSTCCEDICGIKFRTYINDYYKRKNTKHVWKTSMNQVMVTPRERDKINGDIIMYPTQCHEDHRMNKTEKHSLSTSKKNMGDKMFPSLPERKVSPVEFTKTNETKSNDESHHRPTVQTRGLKSKTARRGRRGRRTNKHK